MYLKEMAEDNTNKKLPLEVINTSYRHDIIKEVLKARFHNPKNKISEDTIEVLSEVAKVLAVEAAVRALKQAKNQYKSKVTLEHVEAILPQLMLDFP